MGTFNFPVRWLTKEFLSKISTGFFLRYSGANLKGILRSEIRADFVLFTYFKDGIYNYYAPEELSDSYDTRLLISSR